MARQDRVSVDLTDLRERIENIRKDALWGEQALTKKVRILLMEYLDLLEKQQQQTNKD